MHWPFALLGLGYLAAFLEKNNYQVDVIDCQVQQLSLDDFKAEIAKRKPDIVGATSSTLTYKSGMKLIQAVREVLPNVVTFAGGPHVTFWDDHALEDYPELDVVIRREGEATLLDLVQHVEAGKSFDDVLGITYRKNGEIVRNKERPYIEDLDALPFPARHLWPMDKFDQYEDVLYLAMTRGCTYWCEFCCTVRMHGRNFRMRSAKNVVDEIEELYKKYGKTKFTFCDDAFTVDKKLVEDLCAEILKRGLKIEWNCGSRVDLVTKELLQKMKEAGCISFWFGAESGTQQVLDAMKKGITPELTEKVIGFIFVGVIVAELAVLVPHLLLGSAVQESFWLLTAVTVAAATILLLPVPSFIFGTSAATDLANFVTLRQPFTPYSFLLEPLQPLVLPWKPPFGALFALGDSYFTFPYVGEILLYLQNNSGAALALSYVFVGVVLAASFKVRRFWCRFCPTGVSIGAANKFKILKKLPFLCLSKEKEKCTKCGICKRVCPVQVTEVYEGGGKIDTQMCLLCLRCVEMCPERGCLSLKLGDITCFMSRNWLSKSSE